MKQTEYTGTIFAKDGEKWTRFVIGNKVDKDLLVKTILALGGEMVKETKTAKHYEIKGDKVHFMMVM